MNSCPNKNDNSYILLEQYLGEKGAMAIYMANNEELPTLEAVKKIIQLDQIKQENKTIEELKQLSKEGLSKKVDSFFNIIKIDWNRLGYSKYAEVRKIFDNPTVGNEFKALYERLKDIAERDEQTQFEQKVRGFALGLQQLNNIINKVQNSIKLKDYTQMNEKEALGELSKYLSFLNEWKYIIEDFQKEFKESPEVLKVLYNINGNIDTTKEIINDAREFALVDEIVDSLEPTLTILRKDYNESVARVRKKRMEAEKRGDKVSVDNYNKRLEVLAKDFNKFKVEKGDVIDYLLGKRGDTNVASALLEAEMSNPDPITSVTKFKLVQLIEQVVGSVYESEHHYQNKIAPLLETLGANRFNPFDFNKQFVTTVKHISKTGKEYNTLELMDKFTGDWQLELEILQNEINQAKKDNDKEAYDKARTKLVKFKKDYMHQEYKDVVYERYELWEDEIGQKAYLKRQEIFDELNAITRKLKPNSSQGFDMTEEEELEYKEELNKLRRLASIYDANGDKKIDNPDEGVFNLSIALRIQEYNKKTRDIYEWKERVGAFERARDRFKQNLIAVGIDENSEEFNTELANWDENNKRIVIKPSFYEDRQRILNKLKFLSSKVKSKVDQTKVKDFEEGWNFIFDQLKGYRDQDGQPIGSEVSESKLSKIREVQEQLEFLKTQMEGLNGLTSEENDELSTLWVLLKAKVKLTQEQKDRKEFLENKRNTLGLSKGRKIGDKYIKGELDEFYNAINELKEIQSRIPTDDYVDTLNQLTAPLAKVYDKETADKLLKDTELYELLKDPTFKSWFEKNHIKVERYNEVTKTKEDVWERVYVWNRIVPNDSKYYETTELSDGTLLNGLPDYQYYYRDVKDKYKTEQIVGTTVDNKGNFLPKSYDKNNQLEAKDDKYINKEFYQLKKEAESGNEISKAKYDLLQARKEQLLKFQEDAPYADRLYLELPRDPKTLSERIRHGDLQGIKNSFLEKLKFFDDASQDKEEVNRKRIDKKVVRADIYGNELSTIPVKFTGKLTADNTSLNIDRSIYKYGLSIESKKALMEEHPFVEALKDTLERHGKYSTSKVSIRTKLQNIVAKTLNYKPLEITEEQVKEQGTYQRLENIRNLQEQYFQGIYNKGMLPWMEEGATTVAFRNYFLNPLLRLAGFGVMSGDIAGATTNQLAGNTYLILDGISGRNFSIKDYLMSLKLFSTRLLPSFIEDINQPLGKKSLEAQLFNLYSPDQHFHNEIGKRYDTNVWLHVGESIKDLFLNPRLFGELQITASVFYAMLYNTRVKYKGELIPLTEAYEKDKYGYIKLKDGVEFTPKQFENLKIRIRQALRETQGNYAKQDKTLLERSALGSALMFMRRYFAPLLLDAWQVKRFNLSSGTREGYNLTAFKVLKLSLEGIKNKTNYWDTFSTSEKLTVLKAMAFWTSTLFFNALILNLDPDDEKRKYKKTKNWDWLRLQLLLQAIRVKSEVEQMTPVGGFNEIIKTIKNPLMIGTKLSQMGGLVELLDKTINDDPEATYSSSSSPMMEDIFDTDSKALVQIYKIMGYRGGGLESFVPGSEKSKETTAYRLKQTVSAQERK